MAGEWIKWTKGLAKKPEVLAIAARLGMSRHAAAALLMEVWEWTDDNVIVRDVSGSEPDKAPGCVQLGDNAASIFDATFGAPGLADAMTAVGWISIRSGSLEFPKFSRHNGKSAKARALDALRKSAVRSDLSAYRPDANRTDSGPEKRREEKSKTKTLAAKTAAGGSEEMKPRRRTPRDDLFDAIVEVTGVDKNAAASRISKSVSTLLAFDPPIAPDEVREFARRFHELCPWAKEKSILRPTVEVIGKHIHELRSRPKPPPMAPVEINPLALEE